MMNNQELRRSANGQGLYSALAVVKYPHLGRITPESLDWLYEVESCGPFLDWLATNIGKENYLSPEELAAYQRIPQNELLSGPLLEAALALDEPAGGDMTDKERERLVATLDTELSTQENRLETVTDLKNQLVDQISRESLELGRLAELVTEADKKERKERDLVMQIGTVHKSCLDGVKAVVEGLTEQYRDRDGKEPVFLSNLQLDQLTRVEKELDQQLASYISAQFGAYFAQLGLLGASENQETEPLHILDLEDEACLDLVRGRDRTEFDRLITEINRLRVCLYQTEVARVEAVVEAAQLRAVASSLEANNNTKFLSQDFSAEQIVSCGQSSSRAVPQLLVECESGSMEQLRYTTAELAAELASLHCRQILATDYEVKARRSNYVLSKLDKLCDLMLERKARQQILDSLIERECVDMLEVQDNLNNLNSSLIAAIRKADQFKMAVKSVAKSQKGTPDSRSLIPAEDTTLTNAHQILQVSGLVGQLPTFSSVAEAVSQLEQLQLDLQLRLDHHKADRVTELQHIEQNIRKVCRLLHVGEGRQGCSLVPGEVLRGIAASDSGARQLEQRLKQLLTAWDRETAELRNKPHLERLRHLWVDFLLQPQVLGPNLRAIQARCKD